MRRLPFCLESHFAWSRSSSMRTGNPLYSLNLPESCTYLSCKRRTMTSSIPRTVCFYVQLCAIIALITSALRIPLTLICEPDWRSHIDDFKVSYLQAK
jgi:hypothetical protein